MKTFNLRLEIISERPGLLLPGIVPRVNSYDQMRSEIQAETGIFSQIKKTQFAPVKLH